MRSLVRSSTRSRGASRLFAPVIAGATFLLLAASPAGADTNHCSAGSSGAGDSYFPGAGNGGYDVGHYDLDVAYNPANDELRGIVKVRASATEDLCSFNLDLLGFDVKRIKVRNENASWKRDGQELTVTPKKPLRRGHGFSVSIRYGGIPVTFIDPFFGVPTAFTPTTDGAMAVGQPDSAATWFPVNDHPSDKASYDIEVDVPDGYEVVANGTPGGTQPGQPGWTEWRWKAKAPMASYLATIAIGYWDVRRWETTEGLPVYDAVDPQIGGALRAEIDSSLAKQGEVLDFLTENIGQSYPFDTVGGIVDPQRPIGFALETQTRPVYAAIFWTNRSGQPVNGDYVIVHELAHQWFGDDVALHRWRDIWLNEGFATYFEYLWDGAHGGLSPHQLYLGTLAGIPADDPFWAVEVGDPGPDDVLSDPIYVRGAMTLEALRLEVGDDDFSAIVRRWAGSRAGGNGTTRQFMELAEDVSGRQLDDLFDTWLFTPEKPAVPDRVMGGIDRSGVGEVMRSLRDLHQRLLLGGY
jgi:aminopeptidase N